MPTLVHVAPDGDDRIKISFAYSRELVARVKEIPGTRWDAARKVWTATRDVLPILKRVVGEQFVKGDYTHVASGIAPPALPWLSEKQVEAVRFGLGCKGWICADSVGTGKSRTLIAWAEALGLQKILIVYPSRARAVWRAELARTVNEPLTECEGEVYRGFVMNDREAQAPSKWTGCHYEIVAAWAGELRSQRFDGVIFDEIHLASNRKAQWTQACFTLATAIQNRVGASGTLIRSGPKNLWAACELVWPGVFGGHWGRDEHAGKYVGYWKWAKRYTGCEGPTGDYGAWDDSGESNADELKARLSTFVIRRTREEAGVGLPPYRRQIVELDLSKHRAAYEKATAKLLPVAEASDPAARQEILDQLRALVDGWKLPMALELAREAIDAGEKVIIATHFHKSLSALIKLAEKACLPKHVAAGWDSPADRESAYNAFAAAKAPCVLLCNTLSSGTSIDVLKCASREIVTTLEWLPDDLIQFEGRVLRRGQTQNVLIQYLIMRGTIDAAMATTIYGRSQVAGAILNEDEQAKSLRESFSAAGYVDHSSLKPLSTRSQDTRDATLASMLSDFKRRKAADSDARTVGGNETDDLLEEDDDIPF